MMLSRTSPRYICNVVGEHDESLAGIMTMFRIMALCKGDHSGSIVNSSCKKDFSRFMKMEQSLSHANVLRCMHHILHQRIRFQRTGAETAENKGSEKGCITKGFD